jgi:hypothetical protein
LAPRDVTEARRTPLPRGHLSTGAFGYQLHRKLAAMGVTNDVVQPQRRGERGKGVKNDRLDALAVQPSPKVGRALFCRIHGFDGFEWKVLVSGGAPRVVGKETGP